MKKAPSRASQDHALKPARPRMHSRELGVSQLPSGFPRCRGGCQDCPEAPGSTCSHYTADIRHHRVTVNSYRSMRWSSK